MMLYHIYTKAFGLVVADMNIFENLYCVPHHLLLQPARIIEIILIWNFIEHLVKTVKISTSIIDLLHLTGNPC